MVLEILKECDLVFGGSRSCNCCFENMVTGPFVPLFEINITKVVCNDGCCSFMKYGIVDSYQYNDDPNNDGPIISCKSIS